MKAIEFKTKIDCNQIPIPTRLQSEFNKNKDKDVRVIVLIDDSDIYDEYKFIQVTTEQFLKGYADSDSIYDNY